MRRAGALACALLLAAGCGQARAGPGADQAGVAEAPGRGPYDAEAAVRPELVIAEPPRAAPGEVVELRFPAGTSRGVGFVLERRLDSRAWDLRYYLHAAPVEGPAGPRWAPVGATPDPWPDIGVEGPGPDLIAIPDDAEPGHYRVCTANAPEAFCAEVEVRAPGR